VPPGIPFYIDNPAMGMINYTRVIGGLTMKIEIEILSGVLVFKTADGLKAVVDVETGEVIHFDCDQSTIQKLNVFVRKIASYYNKFYINREANDFIEENDND
jgi:hypothetical protein